MYMNIFRFVGDVGSRGHDNVTVLESNLTSTAYSVSIPIKEQCVFVGLLVCPLFIGHTTFVHFAALPPSGRESRSRRRGRPRARGRKHAQREHARMPYNFSTKKSYADDAFQKQNRTRARMLSYYSLLSLGVFTFRIVLNRT